MVNEQIVNLKTLANILGCSQSHVYTLIGVGMPYHQLGPQSRRYFVVEEVISWLKSTGKHQVTA